MRMNDASKPRCSDCDDPQWGVYCIAYPHTNGGISHYCRYGRVVRMVDELEGQEREWAAALCGASAATSRANARAMARENGTSDELPARLREEE